MNALDLFCGLGGWSDGLAAEGFDVLGIDIEPKILARYKHPFLLADVRELDGTIFHDYDLIVGSPPCRDFCRYSKGFGTHWRTPANPQRGLALVLAFLRIVREAKPRYWLMENVPGLAKHLLINPRCTIEIAPHMKRSFWGNFPNFKIPFDVYRPPSHKGFKGPLASWQRSKIPLPVARALGRAVAEKLRANTLG